jgi:hypothetical protein
VVFLRMFLIGGIGLKKADGCSDNGWQEMAATTRVIVEFALSVEPHVEVHVAMLEPVPLPESAVLAT